MPVIVDTPFSRPEVGIHYNYSPAEALRTRAGIERRNMALQSSRQTYPRVLEARWAVGDDGRLACSWVCASSD